MIKTTAQKIYLGLIFIFLYAPIVTLIVLSFNASKTRAKWGGFTTKWYAALFQNEQIMQALWNTLALAVLSALIATCSGSLFHKISPAKIGRIVIMFVIRMIFLFFFVIFTLSFQLCKPEHHFLDHGNVKRIVNIIFLLCLADQT